MVLITPQLTYLWWENVLDPFFTLSKTLARPKYGNLTRVSHFYCFCCCSVTKSCLTLCEPHRLQHARLPSPPLSPGVCSNSCPLILWCYPIISSSVTPLVTLPSISVFSNKLAVCIRWPKYWSFSFSIFQYTLVYPNIPMNIQDWAPLGWTGWISLPSSRLSGVFSGTTVWKYQFPLSWGYLERDWVIKRKLG